MARRRGLGVQIEAVVRVRVGFEVEVEVEKRDDRDRDLLGEVIFLPKRKHSFIPLNFYAFSPLNFYSFTPAPGEQLTTQTLFYGEPTGLAKFARAQLRSNSPFNSNGRRAKPMAAAM